MIRLTALVWDSFPQSVYRVRVILKKHPTMVGHMFDGSFKVNVVLPGGQIMVGGIGEHKTDCWGQMSPLRWNVRFYYLWHDNVSMA